MITVYAASLQVHLAWQDEVIVADVAHGADVAVESPMPARPTKRRLTAPRPDVAAPAYIGASHNFLK